MLKKLDSRVSVFIKHLKKTRWVQLFELKNID